MCFYNKFILKLFNRYELRDDRRKEIVRSSSHIDAVKRDIMRTMSSTTRLFAPTVTKRNNPKTCVAEEESDYFDDSDNEIKYFIY